MGIKEIKKKTVTTQQQEKSKIKFAMHLDTCICRMCLKCKCVFVNFSLPFALHIDNPYHMYHGTNCTLFYFNNHTHSNNHHLTLYA